MTDLEYGFLIGLLTLSTVVTRSLFFLLGNAVKMPAWVQHALRFAPAAALAAILAPDLLLNGGAMTLPWTNPKLIAGILATLFFLGTRHLLGTIIVGMACFSVMRLMLV
jgi:branched-subunit amino acid transport protein